MNYIKSAKKVFNRLKKDKKVKYKSEILEYFMTCLKKKECRPENINRHLFKTPYILYNLRNRFSINYN